MTDPLDHPAEGPEQEITSGAEAVFERAAAAQSEPEDAVSNDEESEFEPVTERAPKLERLQKILAQAGIASRRHAEELITAGRVQVNGQTITVLGAKADSARDHIRVDGKLLHGAERLRYFVLNKPKGYVTTVSDPEGRPTVMTFFSKLGERLYPVGRLDYQSEGLLLVTNDGPLANDLTRAANAVEKTYLVKVAGQPTEEDLDRLRNGVTIAKGRTGPGASKTESKVRTAPARIKQLRAGNNPWFEVVLTEGRNRELRKMFEEIGHHVEKIRRVGYGPLALDVEPGKMRELLPEEVEALRLTAAGKLKPRRLKTTYMLPKEAGMTTEEREQKREARKVRNLHGKPLWKKSGSASDRPTDERFGKQSFRNAKSRGFERPAQKGRPWQSAESERGEFRAERKPFRHRNDREDRGFEQNDRTEQDRRSFGGRFGNRFERGQGEEGGKREFHAGSKPKFHGKPPSGSKPKFTGKPKFGGKLRDDKAEGSSSRSSYGRKSSFGTKSGSQARSGSGPRPGGKPKFGSKPKFGGKAGGPRSGNSSKGQGRTGGRPGGRPPGKRRS